MFKKFLFVIGISSFLLSGIFAATIHSRYISEAKLSPTATPTATPTVSPTMSPSPDDPTDDPTDSPSPTPTTTP